MDGDGSIPMKIPCLGEWTSINPSYFDVNYRGTIGFDTLPNHHSCRGWHPARNDRSSGVCDPGHAYRTCPPGKWGAQANCPEETIWRWIDRGFHGISWDFTENFSQLVLGTSWNYGFLLDFWKLALDSPWIPKTWWCGLIRNSANWNSVLSHLLKNTSLGSGRRTNRNYRKWRTLKLPAQP